MAIVGNLIVNGAARCLNTLYVNDMTVSGTTTFATLAVTGTSTFTGKAVFNGHLAVGYNSTDANGTLSTSGLYSNGWLRSVGNVGWYSSSYGGGVYMKDNKAIRTYGSKNFFVENANLYVGPTTADPTASDALVFSFKSDGSLTASSIKASSETVDNLQVTDTLKSFKWDIQHVANLGGDFLVTPTYTASASATISSLTISGNTITMSISDASAITSNSFGGVQWLRGAKVKVSGEIGGVVIGTCDGTLTADMNSTSGALTVQFTYPDQTATPGNPLEAGAKTAAQIKGITVMLTQVVVSSGASTTYPVGIYITSYEKNAWPANDSKAKPSISIYGGTATTAPVVRIGSMAGLSAIGSVTPSGWGIYTSNGYFSGTVVGKTGVIGGWSINETYGIYTNSKTTATSTNSGILIQKDGGIYAGAYNSTNTACPFQVTNAGTLTAISGRIGKFSLTNTYLYTGSGSTQAGMGGNQAFWAGSTDSNSAPFRVGYDGSAVFTNATLGDPNAYHVSIDSDSLDVMNGSEQLASFGQSTVLGAPFSGNITLDSGGIIGTGNNNSLFFNISGNGASITSSHYKTVFTKDAPSTTARSGTCSDLSVLASETNKNFIFYLNWTRENGTSGVGNIQFSYGTSATRTPSVLGTQITVTYNGSTGFTITWSSVPTGGIKYTAGVRWDIASNSPFYEMGYANPDGTKGGYGFIEGYNNIASGNYSHAEGSITTASGGYSHAEGGETTASGTYSHAEGFKTKAQSSYSHAEGNETTASGSNSHAEGLKTTASVSSSHAEGWETTASGTYSHAEGAQTTASGSSSHAEGAQTTASTVQAHAEGYGSVASGAQSHAQNYHTIANGNYQTAIGKYNVSDTTSAFIIGKGTADNARSNALTIDWSGNADFSGTVKTKKFNQIITGTGTAASDGGASDANRYKPAKWTFNTGMTVSDGDIITIKIPVAGHDYGVYVSINNGTNYYPVASNSRSRLTTHYPAGSYITLIYESAGVVDSMFPLAGGTSRVSVTGIWRVINFYDSNSDNGYYHRRIYPNLKAGTGGIYPYTLIMQLSNGRWSSIVTSSVTSGTTPKETGKAANTNAFMPGRVLLMYANATYSDGGNIGTYNIWSAYTGLFDARYSLNLTSSAGLTGYTPVYLVGTLDSNNMFKLDTTKWWTQTLPSSDDGKLYIYIGDAYDWYRITLTEEKPVYWYKNGKIQLYSGASTYALTAGSASTATTASSLSGFTNTTTSATAVDSATQNGHVYVNGTSGIYNQSDGACFVQAYSTSWVSQIYQDYRTGQIALRGKNNGTWQSWRKVLDSSNYTDYTVTKTGSGASGSWGINITGSSASCTGNAATASSAATLSATLAVGKGGTGKTTGNDAANYFLNELTTETSDAQGGDYLIAQYAGGGTTTTTYHRRPVNKVVNATVVKTALGTNATHGGAYLRKDGTWNTPIFNDFVDTVNTSSASTYSYSKTLESGAAYLLIITKLNTTTAAYNGLYLISAHSTNSSVVTLAAASSSVNSVSCSALNLSVSVKTSYIKLDLIKLH